jgi:ubiquinone/menaquinone biosynthesis C-methylase UbiE
MTEEAALFIGNIPDHYDRGLGPVIFVDYAADIAQRVAALNPPRVLETAAGTGIVSRRLRDLLPAGVHLTVTDLNPPMLEVARNKFRPGEQVEFQSADATALPFADQSFDAVVCQFGVMFFPDKDKAYREVYRVLAPGGCYLFSIWDSHRYNRFGRLVQDVVELVSPADPPRFMYVPFSYPFEPIKDSLVEAGFTDITAAVVRRTKEIPDAASFARGLICGSPIFEEIRNRDLEPEPIVDALAREFRREFGADPGRVPLQAIVFSAKRPA